MGPYEIRTEIEICATPEQIWSILTDFASHSEWNPFVTSIEGDVRTGAKLTVSVKPEGGKGMTFRPTVLKAEPNEELRWVGRFLIPGLFDGEHYFLIRRIDAARSRFTHGEVFSGILVPLFKSSLDTATRAGFMAMNRSLKERVERAS